MKCKYPYDAGRGRAFPCGQCLPCRFNRRRVWTHRIMLEAAQYADNSFITLTYDDDHMPADMSLRPKDVQVWLKRFRKAVLPHRIRFYLVGEYGDTTQRPHYHVAVFGYPPCRFGHSQYSLVRKTCCSVCETVRDTWTLGHILVGTLEVHSAQYIAGYVTKKMTSSEDPRLLGRHPEFARMSLRPGIGLSAMHEVASVLMDFNLDTSQSDVPVTLRHGSRQLPLGRYLRRKLRLMVGRDEAAPQELLLQMVEELRPVYEAAQSIKASTPEMSYPMRRSLFRDLLIEQAKPKVAQMEARARIFKGSRKL